MSKLKELTYIFLFSALHRSLPSLCISLCSGNSDLVSFRNNNLITLSRPAMSQHPPIKLWIIVRICPAIVLRLWISRKLDVLGASLLQRLLHFQGLGEGDDVVKITVMNPLRYMLDVLCQHRITSSAYRRERGETVRRVHAQRPGAVTAHAEAGDVNAVQVHTESLNDLIQESREN